MSTGGRHAFGPIPLEGDHADNIEVLHLSIFVKVRCVGVCYCTQVAKGLQVGYECSQLLD